MPDRFYQCVTVLFLLYFVGHIFVGLNKYEKQWVCGRYGMPRSLVRPDGRTYADGTRINDVTRMMIRADIEEEFELGLCAFIAVALICLARVVSSTNALRRQLSVTNQNKPPYRSLVHRR